MSPNKPSIRLMQIFPDDVYDGDPPWLGEISVRLAGIDAPEGDQICRSGSTRTNCPQAKRHLQTIVNGALVTCVRLGLGRSQHQRAV